MSFSSCATGMRRCRNARQGFSSSRSINRRIDLLDTLIMAAASFTDTAIRRGADLLFSPLCFSMSVIVYCFARPPQPRWTWLAALGGSLTHSLRNETVTTCSATYCEYLEAYFKAYFRFVTTWS